ncbi:hypothetical protein FRC09_016518 [Ceratobasidium sp. 395]|nr:hypothetical protein FRC09_016518 [Ceratobasidium sp. 395]
MYRAHLPQLDDDDLEAMEADLAEFHELKHIFVSQGGLTSEFGWNGIPKLHMLSHYVFLIREYGTVDGYSTDISERLHIDRVKTFYRSSNKVDPIEQMVTLLQRQDAWVMQRRKLEEHNLIPKQQKRGSQRDDERTEAEVEEDEEQDTEGITGWDEEVNEQVGEDQDEVVAPVISHKQRHQVLEHHPDPILCYAKTPSKPRITGKDIARQHEAPGFLKAVKEFVSRLPDGEEHAELLSDHLRFGVWTKISLVHDRLPFAPLVGRKIDLIRARPVRVSERLIRQRTSTFDTVLLEVDPSAHGIHRYCAARVRVIFRLPSFCHELTSEPLAYVELFTPFTTPALSSHRLSQTSHTTRNRNRVTRVVPISQLRMGCHLPPEPNVFERRSTLSLFAILSQPPQQPLLLVTIRTLEASGSTVRKSLIRIPLELRRQTVPSVQVAESDVPGDSRRLVAAFN